MLPVKTILWTSRVDFWQTCQKQFAWIPRKVGVSPIKEPRNICSSDYRAGKILPKTWKVTAQIVKYKLDNVFYQRSCFPWKQFCGHVECSSDRPVNRNLRGVRKKIGINPIKKPRNQCSSDYRAWKDLPKNQKIIRLNSEKHL